MAIEEDTNYEIAAWFGVRERTRYEIWNMKPRKWRNTRASHAQFLDQVIPLEIPELTCVVR